MKVEIGKRVLVTGATGAVGGALVERLCKSGLIVRAASRAPAVAQGRLPGLPAEWVDFDFERPATFAAALAGVDRVFLISRPGDDAPQHLAAPFIAELVRHGVERVVNLSAMGTDLRPATGLAQVERLLEQSGLAYTHLRPNWFMQIFMGGFLLPSIRDQGLLRLPAASARVSYVDTRDVAAVAEACLLGTGHKNIAYTLTGGVALDMYEIAETLTRVTRRSIQYVPVDDDSAVAILRASGLDLAVAARAIAFYDLMRRGFCEPVSPAIGAVLGRPPIPFSRFAADHASAWNP